jgi:hypothetical protein
MTSTQKINPSITTTKRVFMEVVLVAVKESKNLNFSSTSSTIWGGDMYPADDTNEYNDAWTMPIGSECVKKVPTEYRITTGA